jgi:hypothetical protein
LTERGLISWCEAGAWFQISDEAIPSLKVHHFHPSRYVGGNVVTDDDDLKGTLVALRVELAHVVDEPLGGQVHRPPRHQRPGRTAFAAGSVTDPGK